MLFDGNGFRNFSDLAGVTREMDIRTSARTRTNNEAGGTRWERWSAGRDFKKLVRRPSVLKAGSDSTNTLSERKCAESSTVML